MSREFYAAVQAYHSDLARNFATSGDGTRHVECRIDDQIYVYLHEDGVHIQTQHAQIPDAWWKRWPADATVRRYVHLSCDIGSARITSLES